MAAEYLLAASWHPPDEIGKVVHTTESLASATRAARPVMDNFRFFFSLLTI